MSKGGWVFLVCWVLGSIWNAWVYEREKARLRRKVRALEVDKIVSDRIIELQKMHIATFGSNK